jgi:signal transduction histidine kinase
LLESTSIEAGRFQIRCQPTDFNKVLSESVRIMKPLLNRRHQSLECHEPANMPLITIDPTRLTQVMVNLLSNASKFSPMDEKIEINLQIMEKRILRVSVADHGPGISPLNRKNIFNRFVRLDTRDGTQYGVGLGLSVVKTIIEEHGGQVGVDEYPVGGSIFWFTIPMNGGIV